MVEEAKKETGKKIYFNWPGYTRCIIYVQGRKGNILCILGQTLDVQEALHRPGDII
jgi:hypothetical protein